MGGEVGYSNAPCMQGPASQEDDIAHAVWSWLLLLLLLLELLLMPWLLLLLLPDGLLCIGSLGGTLDTAHASLLWVENPKGRI